MDVLEKKKSHFSIDIHNPEFYLKLIAILYNIAIMNSTHQIVCSKCGSEIDVSGALSSKIEAELISKYNKQYLEVKTKQDAKKLELEKLGQQLQQQKDDFEEQLKLKVQQELTQQKKALEKQLREDINKENGETLSTFQKQIEEKNKQLADFYKLKTENETLKQEQEVIHEKMRADFAEKLRVETSKTREQAMKDGSDKIQKQLDEKEHVIKQLNDQLLEAQRKAQQGSMQVQGEVQELAIEDFLRGAFPYDTIDEIKKGARGGDCIQQVNTTTRLNCGTIYYESKRTKDFQPSWIEKFKNDIRNSKAMFGVLVTEVMPKDMPHLGLREGIWICTFEEFKGLSMVLRESVILMSEALASQENKGDKMHLLYSFLTGNEFKQNVEAMVEGFIAMQADLHSEKRAMEGIWKKREKQIDKVLLNTTHMYSSIKGIAGSAIADIKHLELGYRQDQLDE